MENVLCCLHWQAVVEMRLGEKADETRSFASSNRKDVHLVMYFVILIGTMALDCCLCEPDQNFQSKMLLIKCRACQELS